MHDTDLGPSEQTPGLIATVSSWIDLCSPDPVIYSISRQVLHLEVAYAAFCGVKNVVVPGPRLEHGNLHGGGVAQFAYTIRELLDIGMYLQVLIMLPMIDDPGIIDDTKDQTLAAHARSEYLDLGISDVISKTDTFGTWDAWSIIRSTCNYNSRLYIGKDMPISNTSIS